MNEIILLNGCRVQDAGEGVFDLAQAKLVPLANHMINDLIVGSKICGNRHFLGGGGGLKETTYINRIFRIGRFDKSAGF